MKKIPLLISALIVSLGFVGSFATANAQQACNNLVITNTGAGSTNVIKCADNLNLKVTCVNNVYTLDANSQTALSGAATVSNTTNGGSAQTGTATNSNNQTVTIGTACGSTSGNGGTTTPTTPTSTSTTTAPGVGSTAAAKQPVAMLPNTANSMTLFVATIVAAVAVLALVITRLIVSNYRHASEK